MTTTQLNFYAWWLLTTYYTAIFHDDAPLLTQSSGTQVLWPLRSADACHPITTHSDSALLKLSRYIRARQVRLYPTRRHEMVHYCFKHTLTTSAPTLSCGTLPPLWLVGRWLASAATLGGQESQTLRAWRRIAEVMTSPFPHMGRGSVMDSQHSDAESDLSSSDQDHSSQGSWTASMDLA